MVEGCLDGKSSGGGRNGSSSQLMVAWVSFKGVCLERTLNCGDYTPRWQACDCQGGALSDTL